MHSGDPGAVPSSVERQISGWCCSPEPSGRYSRVPIRAVVV